MAHNTNSVPDARAAADAVLDVLPPDLGATFDHVALAAPRVRDLLPLWRDCLGGVFGLGADNPEVGWRTVRLRFSGQMVIELIEPLAGSTFFDSFFARHPTGGVHHVTFLVDDVTAVRDRLQECGFSPFGYTEDFQLFVHPREASGVLVQFMARHDDHFAPMTVEDVLAGHGYHGTGVPSP